LGDQAGRAAVHSHLCPGDCLLLLLLHLDHFNPHEAADNMRKYGGFIPGIRPGRNTADYMNNILSKITVVGGLYLRFCA
jgi:hypothetical protein